MIERRPALGKGLSALIPDAPEPPRGVLEVDIDLLAPNDLQPRVQMDESKLQEHSDTIKAHRIIQPIQVRRTGNTNRILAGERRFLTKNTTMLFHLAGRTFAECKRFTTADMENMLKEDRLKDYQYACVIADRTNGAYDPERIIDMMAIPGAWHRCLAAIAAHGADTTAAHFVDIKLFALDGRRRHMWRAGFTERDSKPFLAVTPRDGDRRFFDPMRWFYCGGDSDDDIFD
jgi:hypothetical protein